VSGTKNGRVLRFEEKTGIMKSMPMSPDPVSGRKVSGYRGPRGSGPEFQRRMAMGEVYFYHLTRQPLEVVLPPLLERARGAGWRVAVRGVDAKHMDWLDERLWLGRDGSFLPHGRAGGPHDADQPVLLTTESGVPNGAACVMSVGGAEVTSDEALRFERVCVLFDGNDAPSVEVARNQWRTLTQAGCKAQYWSQESGRWLKKAETR